MCDMLLPGSSGVPEAKAEAGGAGPYSPMRRDAVSGIGIAYSGARYAMPGTVAYVGTCYAMSGTDLPHGGTRRYMRGLIG
eukprot:1749403-Rhodomonas_salina.6